MPWWPYSFSEIWGHFTALFLDRHTYYSDWLATFCWCFLGLGLVFRSCLFGASYWTSYVPTTDPYTSQVIDLISSLIQSWMALRKAHLSPALRSVIVSCNFQIAVSDSNYWKPWRFFGFGVACRSRWRIVRERAFFATPSSTRARQSSAHQQRRSPTLSAHAFFVSFGSWVSCYQSFTFLCFIISQITIMRLMD